MRERHKDGLFESSLETVVADLAQVVSKVDSETLAAGHWVTKIRAGKVVRIYPDGQVEVVREASRR